MAAWTAAIEILLYHQDEHITKINDTYDNKNQRSEHTTLLSGQQWASQLEPAAIEHSLVPTSGASAMHTASCVSGPARYPGCIANPSHVVGFSGLQEGAARPKPAYSITPENSGWTTSHATEMDITVSLHPSSKRHEIRMEPTDRMTDSRRAPRRHHRNLRAHEICSRSGLSSEHSTAAHCNFVHSGVSCI